MKKLKIGIVGCGAIGSSLAKTIIGDFKGEAKLCGLYDIDLNKAKQLSDSLSKNKNLSVSSLKQLIAKSEFIIEASSAQASWDIARNTLSRGRQIMVMSAGGVVNHLNQLRSLAARHNTKAYIPSGAICGVDGLKALSTGRIKKVVLKTTKNPLSFSGIGRIKKEKILFSGTARSAVKYFPQNINVAAVLSMAGIGAERTQVKIIASPKAHRNIHEVEILSDSANIFTRTENIPHPDNPKTSFLAVLSAVAALRQVLEPLKIGT